MNDPRVDFPAGEALPATPLPFSQVVRFGDLVLVSGQASVDGTGKIIPDTFEGEFQRALENLRRILAVAESDLDHVLQTRNYVRDPGDIPLYNQLYARTFKPPYPARTTITGCLPNILRFEIECVAVRKSVAQGPNVR